MKRIHNLFRRQLIRFFNDPESIPAELQDFVEAVNDTYEQSDADRAMLERSLELSSQELLQANSDMRAVFQVLPDLFFRLDGEGTILDFKAGSETDFYLPPKSLLGKRIQNIPIPGIGEKFGQAIREVQATKSMVSIEYSLLIRHRVVYYEARLLPLLADEIITIIRDITERKQAEETLRSREELLRATLESTADGILVVNEKGQVTHSNARFTEMWRIPGELMETKNDNKLLEYVLSQLEHPQAFLSKVQELYGSSDESFDILQFRDGRVFERYSYPLIRDGNAAGRVWSFGDITKRKQAEEELRKSEEMLQLVMDNIPQFIFWKDSTSQYLGCNKNFARVAGVSQSKDIVGKTDYDLAWKNEEADFFRECDSRVMNTDIPEYNIIEPQLQADGKQAWLETNKVPLHDVDGNVVGILGTFEDITERKYAKEQKRELQEKLERAERMESLGILAGGVAHDLNNILGPLVGYPELMLMTLPEGNPLRGKIARLGNAAQAAADVVQDLLTLARRGRYEKGPVNLNDIIKAFLDSPVYAKLAERHTPVTIHLQLDNTLANINGSTPHLSKVVMNLIVNAFEAMSEGGELTIATYQRHITQLASGHDKIEPGEYVIFQVKDTGMGIDPNDLEKIFEPYYSKKVMGTSGSGLGLSVVYGVVKDHHGYYDIFSTVGEGTEFVLYLPVANQEVKTKVAGKLDIRGNETVLVVEDNEEQRIMARELLTSLGYVVDTVANGHEAVEYLKRRAIDIVVLDMIMEEDFDGLDTYREIIKYRAGQKAVIVSGFSATDRVRELRRLGAGQYVRKPYTRQAIGRAIRDECNQQATPLPDH
ncbi:PAS domain-containing protein [Candidatus Zixiibacteriota bacterium]